VAGVTTKYLVGEVNPTGYAQVFAELSGANSLLRGYEWGLQLEAVRDFTVNPNGTFHYYGHDGHGSVRWLTDSSGSVTDTYDYDAFGNLISSSGTTAKQLPLCWRTIRSRARHLLQPRPVLRPETGQVLEHGRF